MGIRDARTGASVGTANAIAGFGNTTACTGGKSGDDISGGDGDGWGSTSAATIGSSTTETSIVMGTVVGCVVGGGERDGE